MLLAGDATFAAADLFNQPGALVTSTVAEELTVTGSGTRAIDLGAGSRGQRPECGSTSPA
ncbi:hypothetical protein GCM10023152_35000 [Agromyces bauzanensis]|uniref:Uncharacterized protein n=1 Tax=Agromyces bauzanensis TaxID=1308924 RepID=A0A917UXY8_9MICO|nr:hypothetical protein GCM10011372_36040 [Agromyces bauzanensis]